MMQVPLVDLKANYGGIRAEVDAAMQEVLDSAAFVLGPAVARFEAAFARYISSSEDAETTAQTETMDKIIETDRDRRPQQREFIAAVGVSNGTDALQLALRAVGVQHGDEVLVQANTFCSSVLAIYDVGATPVLVDIESTTMMVDVGRLESKITPKTKAIMPVHLYGIAANMDEIVRIAKKYDLKIVEDASQAHGCEYKGRRVGTFGDIAAFSLYPGKNLGAYGDAGIIVTRSAAHAETLRLLRNLGQSKKYHHDVMGYNHRLDTLQAAVLNVKLKYLDGWNQRRREVAEMYSTLLKGVGDIVLPSVTPGCQPVWHLYVIRTDRRDDLFKHLTDNGIGAQIHYPIPIHRLEMFRHLLPFESELPNTDRMAKRILSIPIYPEISQEQIDYVVKKIKEFFH